MAEEGKAETAMAESAEKQAESAEKPAESAEKPAESAEKPAESAEKPTESAEKPAESAEKPAESAEKQAGAEKQPESAESQPENQSETALVPAKKKEYVYVDKMTPEQRKERTLRIVDEILARKNSEAAHVHHRTIEARGMYKKQKEITRELQRTRDDILNVEVEVNDIRRQMMLRRSAPSGVWRADKFIYEHPRLKYSLEDFTSSS